MRKVVNIDIRFIPYEAQRYDTCGDWWCEGETLHIRASETEETPSAFLVALHELVESWLCRDLGITEEEVDRWDAAFGDQGELEPGDDPAAPYHRQHRQAMLIEHLMANFMGLTDYGTVS